MPNQWSRREFLIASGLAAFQPAVSQTQPQAFILGFAPELGGKAGEEKWWHACDECMRLGFHYTETNNGNIRLVETYKDRPAKFKDEMAKRKLTMAGFAWSTTLSDRSRRQDVIDQNMQVARFLQAVGGKYITHLFSPRPNGSLSREQAIERITKEEIKDFAATANELGKRMQEETGIRIAYHTERTEARFHLFDSIMEATDPRYFHFWADVGHLTAGGANPLDLIKKYRSRLIGVHLKDYDPNFEVERNGRREKGWFVPIGKGIVKFAPIIAYLKETRFNGHAMIELDGQPDPTEQMRDYAVKELGLKT